MRLLLIVLMASFFAGCFTKSKLRSKISPEQELLSKIMKAHGMNFIEDKSFTFDFRTGNYQFVFNNDRSYEYQSTKEKEGNQLQSRLSNTNFEYSINNIAQELNAKKVQGLSNSLNSVIYFATLPYKLSDESVFLKLLDDQTISGKKYYQLEVTFSEEGGGTDYDDVFHYWINQETLRIDFLAYVYHTGKGGVRFREAFNARIVDKVLFQDYKNFKADKSTALSDLPSMWENNQLTLLSEIKTENIARLNP